MNSNVGRWREAVERANRAIVEIDALPPENPDRVCLIANEVFDDLDGAYRAFPRPEHPSHEPRPWEEWQKTYGGVRDAILRFSRRSFRAAALTTVEETRLGMVAALARITELVAAELVA